MAVVWTICCLYLMNYIFVWYSLEFPMGRLKTGTPARLIGDTIDYTGLEKQFSDSPPQPFSALNVHSGVALKDSLGKTFECLR